MLRATLGAVWGALLAVLAASVLPGGPALADQNDRRLDGLFERLQATDEAAQARRIEREIWRVWLESDDALVERLMRRGIAAMELRRLELALESFDRIVERAPAFAEGWNKRATVRYLMGDLEASVLDIGRTLDLEPRHFGALSGLGLIYDAIQRPRAALRSFEAALELNPHLAGTKDRIEALRRELRDDRPEAAARDRAGRRRARDLGEPMTGAWLTGVRQDEFLRIDAGGPWTLAELMRLERARVALLAGLRSEAGAARIDLKGVDRLDTAGAWLLYRLERELGGRGWRVELAGLGPAQAALLDEIRRVGPEPAPPAPRTNPLLRLVADLGRGAVEALNEGRRLLAFYGQTLIVLARVLANPRRLRPASIVHHLEQTCIRALPIVGLIAFLIGVVMAYQGADQLRRFGAEIFTVNLLGLAILREIGILLTAIVVAGRSGSAFTAQIGTMQVNEEIDAMRTIGLDPIEVLVLPRLLALMLALPLLAFFADVLGLLGGGLMCALALDIPPRQFLAQLDTAITVETFLVGLVKAPVFAFLIAMVGCYEGLRVERSAESVGRLTTQSVVVGIFLVIVFDALFSVLFSYLGV